MDSIEELKMDWRKKYHAQPNLDKSAVSNMINHRRKAQINRVMQYFWASFVYQLIVYALFSHVIVRFWNQPEIVIPALAGIVIFIPFTFMLITRFRKVALPPVVSTVREHIYSQFKLLKRFFQFKKQYEFFLIPLSVLIGVHLCINIFTAGGVLDYPVVSAALFVTGVLACAYAIKRENERNFGAPLRELEALSGECVD